MLSQFKWFWLNILSLELLQSIIKNKLEHDINVKCKGPMYETPIQKTNPNRKHKIKKQLFEKNKTV